MNYCLICPVFVFLRCFFDLRGDASTTEQITTAIDFPLSRIYGNVQRLVESEGNVLKELRGEKRDEITGMTEGNG